MRHHFYLGGLLLIVICYHLIAAEITAPKMEIIDTEQGRATSFPQGITIIDKETKITGTNALFWERDNVAEIFQVLIETPQFKITAETARYFFDEKRTMLKKTVRVESETLLIVTENLTLNNLANIVYSESDIFIREKIHNIEATGKNAQYNFKEQIAIIDIQPRLKIIGNSEDDAVVIQSRKMFLKNREAQFYALESVYAYSANTILQCESLIFYLNGDSGLARGNPKVIDNQNDAQGEVIKFFFGEDTSSAKNLSLNTVQIINSAVANYYSEDGKVEVWGKIFSIHYQAGKPYMIRIQSDNSSVVSGKYIFKEEI